MIGGFAGGVPGPQVQGDNLVVGFGGIMVQDPVNHYGANDPFAPDDGLLLHDDELARMLNSMVLVDTVVRAPPPGFFQPGLG